MHSCFLRIAMTANALRVSNLLSADCVATEGMEFTTTKLPRVGSKAYQQEKAAERAAKLKQEEQALKQARIKAGVPDPAQYMW